MSHNRGETANIATEADSVPDSGLSLWHSPKLDSLIPDAQLSIGAVRLALVWILVWIIIIVS